MDDVEIMPKLNERQRVKDRIIEGIAKAVKHIQSYQLSQISDEDQVIALKNSDWQFHKLVENLDHAFLYGLRHFSNGYWVIVQEFTHRSTIDDICKMSNIVTNLGRSRAWLYLALSEHLLESYVLCFMKNTDLVRKHYVKEALFLDEQRLQLLLTLSSGLDMVAFDLEVNIQYLDLCSHMKVRTESQELEEEEEDNISLRSMISSQSQGSSFDEAIGSHLVMSPFSILTNLIKPLGIKSIDSPSSLTWTETEAEKKLRIESFANTQEAAKSLDNADGTAQPPGEDESTQEVEVTHIKPKRHHGRRKERQQKYAGSSSASAPSSDNISLISVESSGSLLSPISSESSSGYRSVPEDIMTSSAAAAAVSVAGRTDEEMCLMIESVSGDSVETLRMATTADSPARDKKAKKGEALSQDERLRRILEDHLEDLPKGKKKTEAVVPSSEVQFSRTLEWKMNSGSDKTVSTVVSTKKKKVPTATLR